MTKEAAKEIISEYVKTAEALLVQEYGSDYTPATVEKLADSMIALDQEYALEKEASTIRQFAFEQELANLGFSIPEAFKNVTESFK